MLKKNKFKILLVISFSLQIFCLSINAMENNKNSITINNLATLNTKNRFSQDKNKDKNQKNDIFKPKESNNFNLKKTKSAENLKNNNLAIDTPKKEPKKIFIPKFNFNFNIKNKKPKFKLNEHNNFINKIIEKNSKEELKELEKQNDKKTEKAQLKEFYNYFSNSFKKISNICKIIASKSYRYRGKPEKNTNKYEQEIYNNYIENIIKNHMNKADKKIIPVGNGYFFADATIYAKSLHKNDIFDIDKQIATIEKNVALLLDKIELLENKYKEYLNFIENIKDKELLNYNFVRNNKNKGILTNDHINMKDIFNIQNMVDKLTKHMKKILDSIKLSLTETQQQMFNNYLNFVNSLNFKNNTNTSISNKIEKEIDVVKKIVYYFIKIVEDRVVATIQDRILGLVDEENKIIAEVSPELFHNL